MTGRVLVLFVALLGVGCAGPSGLMGTGGGARVAEAAPGRPGFVLSPYVDGRLVDVRGVPSGTVVEDPYARRPLRVP